MPLRSRTASRSTRRDRAALTLLAAALCVLAFAVPASAQAEAGTVTVLHGVPDLTVDVYVNGELTLEDFEPGTVTDPLSLPAGDYDVEIRPADSDPASDPAITGSASLPAGANASIVAHLDGQGEPALGVFVNDTSPIAAGSSRLTVRHTAAAPAVDVLADGAPIVTGLENPDEATASVPPGTYEAAVAPTGTTEPVLGPADLPLDEGTATIAYAIGSAEAGTLDLLVQTIPDLHSAPTGVPAGDGGQAGTMPGWIVLAGVAGLLAMAGAGATLSRARA